MVSFSSLNMFIVAALKSLLNTTSGAPEDTQTQFLVTTFFLSMDLTFLFLCTSHIFLFLLKKNIYIYPHSIICLPQPGPQPQASRVKLLPSPTGQSLEVTSISSTTYRGHHPAFQIKWSPTEGSREAASPQNLPHLAELPHRSRQEMWQEQPQTGTPQIPTVLT